MSWDLLDEGGVDDTARFLFRGAGYCAANTVIPREVLQEMGKDEEKVDFALRRLEAVGLVECSEQGIILHPLIAEAARKLDGEAEASALPAMGEALDSLAYQANKSGYPVRGAPYRPHLAPVGEALREQDAELTASLFNNQGYLLQEMGDLPGARPYLEQALAIQRATLGEQHPTTATGLNNLGVLLQDMGDLPGARLYLEQALAISKATLGEQQPDTARGLNNLG